MTPKLVRSFGTALCDGFGRRRECNCIRGAKWLGLGDSLDQLRGTASRGAGGVLSGEQNVKQDAERVNVRGSCNSAAGDLFGRGELRSQGRVAIQSQHGGFTRSGFIAQKFSDAEVKQLYLAIAADQHIRRLEVAVNDQ